MARRSQRHARIAVTLFPRRELTHAASERGGAGCRARSVTSGRPQPVSTKYRADQFPHHCLLLFKGGDQLSSSIFEYVPHPYVAERRYSGSSTSDDPLGPIQRANAAAARFVTTGVGTMWCAYLFAIFAGLGFPGFLPDSVSKYTLWGSTVFAQLVLLSVILVGQNEQAEASEARAQATYRDAEVVLHEALQIQEHLIAQDAVLERLLDRIEPEGPALAEEPTPSGSAPLEPEAEPKK